MQATHVKKDKSETRNNLTNLVSQCILTPVMARSGDVLKRIQSALVVDASRLREISEEMDKRAEAHHRYIALRRESEAHEKSAQHLMALLGPDGFLGAMKTDKSDAIGWQVEIVPSPAELRAQAALWEHTAQYLRFVSDARIGEIVDFLSLLSIETSKQAIESAIRTHPKVFAVKRKGREKFISLK